MLYGFPEFFDFVVELIKADSRRGSLAIVIHYLLGDLVNAAEHALTHYFPLTLSEQFLQNSSLGTPYQKWARFTNEDFQKVDLGLRRLIPAVWKLYDETSEFGTGAPNSGNTKDAWYWFYKVNTEFACCIVNPDEPALTVTALNIAGWVNTANGRFLNLVNRPKPLPPLERPPITANSTHDIRDRTVIEELHKIGLSRTQEMRAATEHLAILLQRTCTIEGVTSSHDGTLFDCWFG
jgi:hypothetical protein